MKLTIGILLIAHGLIVAAQSAGSFSAASGVPNPAWLSWWPTNLGQSWLLAPLSLERTLLSRAGGFVWLISGIALVTSGLGVFGMGVPIDWWRRLALGGAAISLVMLLAYLHPFYGIGIGASVLVLAAVLWQQGAPLARLGL